MYKSIAEVKKFTVGSTQGVKSDDGRDGKILRLLVLVLAVIGVLTMIYCCLKHRSKICCRRGKGRDSQLEQDSIASVDMTPKKVAVQADSVNLEDPSARG